MTDTTEKDMNGVGLAAPRTTEQLVTSGTVVSMASAHRPARSHGYGMRGLSYLPLSPLYEGRFGRMFRLQPYVPSPERITQVAALMKEDLRGAGGPPPRPDLDNPQIPAGYTYLGQFIDHDLTFDPVSSLVRQTDPDALRNFRSPRFDLDSLYGRGPADDPFLYDKTTGNEKLLVGSNGRDDDLPRNSQGRALIGDPRNDENTFVSQLQLTFIKFHNAVLDRVHDNPSLIHSSETPFEAAQRIVRWHYQWVVVHDFLRRIVGEEMLNSVLVTKGRGLPEVVRRFYKWRNNPFMPVEFAVAAYRFGHSMVRGRYRLNSVVGAENGGLPIFLPTSVDDPATLLGHFGGFRPLPRFWTIEWARFFEVDGTGGDARQRSRRIDTKLADPLAALPPEIAPTMPSLIERNLTRGARLLLPSGQDVAHRMGARVLTAAELGLPGGGPAPLWYYVLAEASVRESGLNLGEVGGRIVAEVFLGLMEEDPSSFLKQAPDFRPFLGATEGTFTMADLLRVAGHGLGPTPG